MSFTITHVVNGLKSSVQSSLSVHFSRFISFIPLCCQLLLLRLIFMHRRDAADGARQQYARGHQRSSTRSLLLREIIVLLFSKMLSRTDPVNLCIFGFNVGAEKMVYCLVLHHILYFQPTFIQFQCSMFFFIWLLWGCRSRVSGGKDLTCQVYGFAGHGVKP